MKTNTFKTEKSQQFNGIIIIAHLIITVAFIAIVVKYAQPEFGTFTMEQNSMSNELADIESRLAAVTNQSFMENEKSNTNEMTYFSPIVPVLTNEAEVSHLETDKLFHLNKERELSIVANETTASSANPASDASPDMATLREYLVPASDPELTFEFVSRENSKEVEFAFRKNEYLENMKDSKMAETDALLHSTYSNESLVSAKSAGTSADLSSNFSPDMALIMEFLAPVSEQELEIVSITEPEPLVLINLEPVAATPKMAYTNNPYLEKLKDMKMSQLDEFYAFQMKVKECLVAEKEAPLTLEEWMTSDRCWCTERNKNIALHDEAENE